ncbi:MAG TPA: cellulase family glycosylhydrolase [Solirubrobacteraceae bacterium]|nr:cellulase family glycosylhydrolase [Solirubrobacteraceae bacterium]
MRTSRLLAVVLLLCVASSAAPASARAAVARDWAGVNAYHLFAALPPSSWDAHLDAMRSAGVRLVRYDASWARVEPAAPAGGVHDYRFGHHDAVVAALARRGIRWYPIVDYSARWAAATPGAWRSPPASVQAYAAYAAALAQRYGPGGTFWSSHPELPELPVREWEVWNEENGAYYWPPAPDPAAYADLYAAARAAIRAVDADARVVVGGLVARSAGAFVRDMLVHRPDLELDAVGLHAYAVHAGGAVQWMESLRGWLRDLGRPGVPIEVTEVGWTTVGPLNLATDEQRAAWLRELLPAAAAVPGVTRLIVHTWATPEQQADVGEDWYGLWHPDASPSASGVAFAEALGALAGEGGVEVPAVPAGGGLPGAPAGGPNRAPLPESESVYAPTSIEPRQLPALHAFAAAPETHRKRVRGKTKCSSTKRSRWRPHRWQTHHRTAGRGDRPGAARLRMARRGGGARTAASTSRSRPRSRTTRATSTRSRGGRGSSARRC